MKAPLVIEPVTAANRDALLAAQAVDGHCAPGATHLWRREGEIVGACGVFAPLATFWARIDLHAREGLDLAGQFKRLADARGVRYLTACSTDSPFHPLLPRLGWRRIGAMDLYEP